MGTTLDLVCTEVQLLGVEVECTMVVDQGAALNLVIDYGDLTIESFTIAGEQYSEFIKYLFGQ